MRISTWPGIRGNYIFKVEQATVFKVDSICKLLGLFLFLHIDMCVQSLSPSSRIQLQSLPAPSPLTLTAEDEVSPFKALSTQKSVFLQKKNPFWSGM